MILLRLSAVLCLLPIGAGAETFIFDFNDVDDPVLQALNNVPLRELDVPGGLARDGGTIVDSWPTNTALLDAVQGAGDLAPSAAITNYFPVQGPPNPAFGPVIVEYEDDKGRGRMNHHDVADFPIGTAWVSFLLRLDPDADGDGPGPVCAGMTLGALQGDTGSEIPATAGAFLGLTHLPAGVPGGPATVVEWSPAGLEFATLSTSGLGVVRGTTSADLGLTPADTHLVVARLTQGTNTIDVWVDPADVTDAATLGTPDLSAPIGFTAITHLGVFGEADEAAPASAEHVKAGIDHVRFSNEALGLKWVTGRVDPLFQPSAGSQYPDYEFGTVFGGADARTVEFVCQSAVGNTVTVESVTLPDNGGGVFSLGTLPGFPLVLNNGESISIPVLVAGAPGTEAAGQIAIDTTTFSASLGPDANDLTLPLNANFGLEGVRLNANPFMDRDLGDWGGGSSGIAPGLAPGSIGMARVKGTGDPVFAIPDALYQVAGIPDEAADWELTFYFSPADTADFASRVDPAGTRGITGPRGEFTDRTFQLAILAGDDNPPNPGFGDAQAANTIMNLAYLPAGATVGGTPDFYLFNGTTGTWLPTGLGAVQGSLDADRNGILDPAAGDTVNAYRMRIRGRNFGSAGAAYDLTLSGGERGSALTSSNITVFHGSSGELRRPAGYAFTTADTSSASNAGNGGASGFTTSFWVDDVAYFAGSGPNPELILLGAPAVIDIAPPATTGTAAMAIRNDGITAPLIVSPLQINGAGLTITTPPGGFSLPAGAMQPLEVLFDANSIAPGNAAAGVLTVTSNDPVAAVATSAVSASLTGPFDRLANGNFEAAGLDAGGDFDTFAVWNEAAAGSTPTLTRDVPGLRAGSATAAYLQGSGTNSIASQNGMIEGTLGTGMKDFEIDIYFAVKDTGRQFNLHLRAGSGGTEMINIRYEAGVWFAYGAPWGGAGWVPLIDLTNGGSNTSPIIPSVDSNNDGDLSGPGDGRHVYRLRISGRDFQSYSATYSLRVYATDDVTLLGESAPTNIFRSTDFLGAPFRVIRFTTQYGGNAGFWVDDVSLKDAGFEALDSDGDGIIDLYENAHGLNSHDPADAASDHDGDGQTAWQESLYGTDAADSLSRFVMRVAPGADGQVQITYGPLREGNSYLLNSSHDMALFSLIDDHTANSAETGSYRVVPDPTLMQNELYKLVVQRR